MSNSSVVMFSEVRKTAYVRWLDETGRSTTPLSTVLGAIEVDDYEFGKYECNWQNEARKVTGDDFFHVPHFCSLGDWAGNVSEVLRDARFDNIPLTGIEEYDEVLFRYYTRFMLIVSELIVDFEGLFKEMFGVGKQDARNDMSAAITDIIDVDQLMGYINSICKHKVVQFGSLTTKLHQCNHHISLFFEDSGQMCSYGNPLKVGDLTATKPNCIIVPKLEHLVLAILGGYIALDTSVKNDPTKFKNFITAKGTSIMPVI